MAEPLRRIVVLTHLFTSATRAALEQLAAARERLGLQLLVPAARRPSIRGLVELGYEIIDDRDVRDADVCLVFGGDGTILRALGRLARHGGAHPRRQLR